MKSHLLTYDDLWDVLRDFGFTRRSEGGQVFYEIPEKSALVPLPDLPLGDPLSARHYMAARILLENAGIVDQATFEKRMRERGELPQGVSPVFIK